MMDKDPGIQEMRDRLIKLEAQLEKEKMHKKQQMPQWVGFVIGFVIIGFFLLLIIGSIQFISY
ncbi:MAG: hypothetical protein ACE3L7_10585 [Candidatus Pristimantibacillus sp.]